MLRLRRVHLVEYQGSCRSVHCRAGWRAADYGHDLTAIDLFELGEWRRNWPTSYGSKSFFSASFHPQIRNLKYLAPFSTFANFITMVSFGLILYYIFETPFTVEDKHAVGEIKNFPLFFGTVLFALEAIGVVSLWVFLLVYWNWGDKTSDVVTWLLKIMSILPKLYIKNISKTFKACNMTNDLFCEDIASLCCQDVIFVQPPKASSKSLEKTNLGLQ